MKPVTSVLFSALMLFALYSDIGAESHPSDDKIGNCQGTEDIHCPQVLCGPKGITGWKKQDNSKPHPECCGGPICAF